MVAFADAHAVSPGHTLVVPRRHVSTYFDWTQDEKAALWALVDQVHGLLSDRNPDGYNVGFNAGAAADQTVFHANIHVIPRYDGDVATPVGHPERRHRSRHVQFRDLVNPPVSSS